MVSTWVPQMGVVASARANKFCSDRLTFDPRGLWLQRWRHKLDCRGREQ
jgi:hypothetical protein